MFSSTPAAPASWSLRAVCVQLPTLAPFSEAIRGTSMARAPSSTSRRYAELASRFDCGTVGK